MFSTKSLVLDTGSITGANTMLNRLSILFPTLSFPAVAISMEASKGSRIRFNLIDVFMIEKQSKNIIKAALAVILCVLIGEGVFSLGIFWPFLLILLEWSSIYWFSLFIGILIASIYHLPVGLPALFLVVVIGGLSFVFNSRKETGWVMLLISILANFVFDKVFGLTWSWWDTVSIVIAWQMAVRWFEKSETIKLNY